VLKSANLEIVAVSPRRVILLGSCQKRQKPQAPTPQAPIRNRQTRKDENAKGLHRNTKPNLYELWRLRLFSFGGYGLALAALALVVFGAVECPPILFCKHLFRSGPKCFRI